MRRHFLFYLILTHAATWQPDVVYVQALVTPSILSSTVVSPHRAPKLSLSVSRSNINSNNNNYMPEWDGDDLRWSSKLRRRWSRTRRGGSLYSNEDPAQIKLLVFLSLFAMFVYQTWTTIQFLKTQHADYWPNHALEMIWDAIKGSSVAGPLVRDFGYSNALAMGLHQPHRFLTSGFLHGGILHLVVNLFVLQRQQPDWLETGLGKFMYATTFFTSLVAGQLAQHYSSMQFPLDPTLYFGANGGLAGLFGLQYVCLLRMKHRRTTSTILKGMATLIVPGLFMERVSTASHIGGFLWGVALAMLCGPVYDRSYSLTRKNSVEYDPVSREYRQAMGFGVLPRMTGGTTKLIFLWLAGVAALAMAGEAYRLIPVQILKGLMLPGSLTEKL